MTVREAREIVARFDGLDSPPSEEETFLFTEAMSFLIEKERRPADMMRLGGHYYAHRQFDLALKYYEMAAELDHEEADECLGYIWYYGRTGVRDFKKAFEYFSRMMERGHLVATYKVADMYRNGYYVEKNPAKYKEMIEALYPKVRDARYLHEPLPEVFTRLARIRVEEGRKEEAVTLYLHAKDFLAQRLSHNSFFGDLNIMEWLIDDLYAIREFDPDDFDFYDIYHLLKRPCRVSFRLDDKPLLLESAPEGDECRCAFEGRRYRARRDFFKNAVVDGRLLLSAYNELYGFRIEE